MGKVRAKFRCDSVEHFSTEYRTAKLSAVYGSNGENKDFTEYTPNGHLSITIQGEVPAAKFFVPGKEYYLDFTESE